MTLGDAKLGNSLTLMVWKIAYTAKQMCYTWHADVAKAAQAFLIFLTLAGSHPRSDGRCLWPAFLWLCQGLL